MHAPATTSRMNAPAPSRAPIASDDVSAVADVSAAIAPNISAAPFPSATKVIPAIFSFKFNVAAIQFNAGTGDQRTRTVQAEPAKILKTRTGRVPKNVNLRPLRADPAVRGSLTGTK